MQEKAKIAIAVIACAMILYQLISTQVFLQSTVAHLNTHLGFCLILVFLGGFVESKSKFNSTISWF
jgi:Na+-translocating ferredoxin:NAD+ oxidoreductase RnfA subunit